MKLKYGLKWFRYHCFFPILAFFPEKIAYKIASLIGLLDAKYQGNRLAIQNGFLTIYPGLKDDPKHLKALIDHHYQMLAKDTLDCFRMPRFTQQNTQTLLKVSQTEILKDAQSQGKGVILIISHFGRFFMLGPGLKLSGIEFGMLTTTVDETNPHYDAVDRWYIAKKLFNTQLFSQGSWFTTADSPRKTYQALKQGEIMLIAMDGIETNSSNRFHFPFLGGTLTLPEGIVRIAQKTGAKMVFGHAMEVGRTVHINIFALPDDPYNALQQSVQQLEQDVIAYPWQWWQWAALASLWHHTHE
jgi:lauroyl/myristoyl acyltransferase